MPAPKKAIILIAGVGTRLRPITSTVQKCMVEVNGKPILVSALEKLEKNSIEECILVIGYLGGMVRRAIGHKFGSMKISYIENDIFDKTNNSYSLWLALKNLNENDLKKGLLILEGDIIFEDRLLREFIKDKRQDLTIVEKYNPNLDGTFVDVGEDDQVLSWIHKKDRPEGFTAEDKYKTVNIHKVSAAFLGKWLLPHLKRCVDESGGKEPIETVFKNIITAGGKIYAFHANGAKWFEIDDAGDLKIAEKIFSKEDA